MRSKRSIGLVVTGITAIALAFGSLAFPAVGLADEFLSEREAARLGLEIAWRRQLEAPAGAQSIADQQIYVHSTSPDEFVEVVRVSAPAGEAQAEAAAPASSADSTQTPDSTSEDKTVDSKKGAKFSDVLMRIPTDRVDSYGRPVGRKEAERIANNEIRRLTRRGIEAKIETRIVPRVRLYTLGNDGTLESRDAETGEPKWMVRVGDRRLGYLALGVGETYATVINGGNLIEIDVTNGEIIEETQTVNMPIFGAIHSGNVSVFPTITGGIEGYSLTDPNDVPFRETVAGRALALPTKAPGSSKIGWGTGQGFFYCMETAGQPSVLFRLNTDGIVSGRVAAADGERFFFGSEAGQVYGVFASRSGQVLWSTPFGEPFYDEALIADDQLLIRSTYGSLYSLSQTDGSVTWEMPAQGVDEMLGTIGDKVYVTTMSGSMAVLDLETGKRLETLTGVRPERLLRNKMTDRLYLVGSSGAIQCLHAIGADLPEIREGFDKAPSNEPVQQEAGDEQTQELEMDTDPSPGFDMPAGDDPFAVPGSDPFGAPGADPFAGDGADPFGG
ncbi:outer membrane protein assembly factor BamB family protein [Novipirellula artificiosorum]|uniref:outer membrane protein assembly factor BamB family protein n=1 Tax=Novipirellula artificiosorum TaxID=2528016 RepID=UPI0018CCD761|nr:PQQ-binding-like beta-propeller repeat protein [Novipirellula artificiosorum]